MTTLSSLSLIHLADHPPVKEEGALLLKTAFQNSDGFLQNPEQPLKARQTLHYSLQTAVTDHAYGQFEGRKWAVVAPLKEAIMANGQPETLLASDVAFFPQSGSMKLPGAILVEFTEQNPPNVFIQSGPDGLKVSQKITPDNLTQAKLWFEDLSKKGHSNPQIQKQLNNLDKVWNTAEITEMGVVSALAQINKPSLNHLSGIEPGAPMGFDGWMNQSDLKALKNEIQELTLNSEKGLLQIGRHDGSFGDQLLSAVLQLNPEKLQGLKENANAPLVIREQAERWKGSSLFEHKRKESVIHEIMEGSAIVTNDLGQEKPGLVGAMFGGRATGIFEHTAMGTIRLEEIKKTIEGLSPERRKQLTQNLIEKANTTEHMPGAYQKISSWMANMDNPSPVSPPPPPPIFNGMAVFEKRKEKTLIPPAFNTNNPFFKHK